MTRKDSKGRKLYIGESERKDGTYQYRFTNENGIRSSIYSCRLIPSDKIPSGKKYDLSLREKEQEIQKKIINGLSTVNGPKLSNYVERYLETKNNLSTNTIILYQTLFEKHLRDTLGNKEIGKIKKSDILLFYKYLSQTKKLKNGTITLMHAILNPAFDLAVDENIILKNPCHGCAKDYSPKNDQKDRVPLTIHQQEIFLDFVKNSNVYKKHYLMLLFMLGTSARVSETIGITWDDIDFEKKEVKIDHQLLYQKIDGEYKLFISSPKTNAGVRIIPLIAPLADQLREYKKLQTSMTSNPFSVDGYSNFVFVTRNGTPYKRKEVNEILKFIVGAYNKNELLKAAADDREPDLLPHITAHVLRHTGCTRMAENGIDIKVLQEIMGHSDISVTMNIYNHVDFDRIHAEADKIQDILRII